MPPAPDDPAEQTLIDEAPVGIFQADENGRYTDVNPAGCEMLGYSRAELLDMSIADVAPETTTPGAIPHFAELQQRGHSRTEGTLLHKAGHEIEVIIDAVALDDTHFVAYVQDITERRASERQLEAQRNNLEILNQVVRHDIRNKLQLVVAYGDLLHSQVEGSDEEYVEKILDAARESVEITTTARDVTEVMLHAEGDHRPVRLRPVIDGEIDDVRSNYDSALVRADRPIPDASVRADEMLTSVFRNLLTNAIQHNDKDIPEVTASATRTDGSVRVRIADNGPGIPDDRKDDIFEQGEMDLDSTGAGLGLYLVDTLVGRYGGDVRVEDNTPEGAVFTVELPVAEHT